MLSLIFRIIAWLSSALAWVNAALVVSDAFRHPLTPWTQGVTWVVAMLFAWIGLLAFGVERNLSRLRPFLAADAAAPEWKRPWNRLHLFLIAGLLLVLLVMLLGLSAIHSRSLEGLPLFG